MTRTIAATRMVVAGMILMGGALGMFGEKKVAAVSSHVPSMEQAGAPGVQRAGTPAAERGVVMIARERSGETDPCVPIAPVSFLAPGPVVC